MQTCLAMQFIVYFWRKYIDSCISTVSCRFVVREAPCMFRTDHLTFNLNFFLDTTAPLPQAAKGASQPLLHHRNTNWDT